MHDSIRSSNRIAGARPHGMFLVLLLVAISMHAQDTRHVSHEEVTGVPPTTDRPTPFRLPPPPPGVHQLKFSDFFKFPIGPLGLEVTEELKDLDGRTVRIMGFMV